MDTLLQDLRYAVRTLVNNPGFGALTILCLALGIGVNSTIFSLTDAVAIRPLPFTDPDHLFSLNTSNATKAVDAGRVSYLDLQDWKERTRSFENLTAMTERSVTLTDRNEPENFEAAAVSWDLFPTLGIQPILGRQFRPEEDRPGGPAVVLLSHPLWMRRYASDRAIVGRSIMVNAKAYTVVGVMPPRFQFPEEADLWMPLTPLYHTEPRANRGIAVYTRLKPGVSLAAARQDLSAVAAQLGREQQADQGWSAIVRTMWEEMGPPPDVRLIVFTMMGSVTLVLLIACANVANLLLARATVRQREIAVRAALGAGRGRIVRQLLTESVLIGLASAPIGALLAYIGLEWLTSSIPPRNKVPYFIDWSMNPRVIYYTCAIAVITGLVFGLAPALQAARSDLHDSLKDGGRGAGGSVRRNRLRSALVVAEIALSLVLLVGASLFVRSFLNLQNARAGLDTRSLLLLRFSMLGDAYQPPDAMARRAQDIVRRVETLPGVVSAIAANMLPYNGGGGGGAIIPAGAELAKDQELRANTFGVTPHWLRTLNVSLIAGRDFTEAEASMRSNVAIVNQVFARRMWPKLSDVIGQQFRLARDKPDDWITVIGVVGDFRLFTVRDGKPSPYAFVSYSREPVRDTGVTIRVAGGAAASIMAAARQEIRRADPSMPIFDTQTGEEARANTYWEFRLFGWMFSIFGVVALLLATIGVYGVLSYSVSQRTQEIGVRMALGASRQHVFGLVVSHGAKLAAAGIVLGLIGAFAVTWVIRSQLYNVSPTDPLSFAATAAFLTLVALAASYVPARRATAVDPMIALRAE